MAADYSDADTDIWLPITYDTNFELRGDNFEVGCRLRYLHVRCHDRLTRRIAEIHTACASFMDLPTCQAMTCFAIEVYLAIISKTAFRRVAPLSCQASSSRVQPKPSLTTLYITYTDWGILLLYGANVARCAGIPFHCRCGVRFLVQPYLENGFQIMTP